MLDSPPYDLLMPDSPMTELPMPVSPSLHPCAHPARAAQRTVAAFDGVRVVLIASALTLLAACSSSGPRLDPPAAPDLEAASESASGGMSNGAADGSSEPAIRTSALPPDADADGVPDAVDQCAESALDQPVDDSGCALFSGPIPNLDFAPGSDQLDATAEASLDKLVASLQAYPDVTIELGGHTDNRGRASNNLELSKRRVMAVARYLVLQGVEPDRLRPFGYGESQPVVSNATEAGRQQNRRIEVSLFEGEAPGDDASGDTDNGSD